MPFLFEGREIANLVGDLAILDDPVWSLNETMDIDPRVGRQRCNQTDVRTFRRLDRADTTVVCRMDVTNFEAGTFTGQTTGAESRETTLMGNFRERIGLIHKLGKLTGTEELLDDSRNRLGVDQVMRHQAVHFLQTHPLLDRTLHPDQADPVLVFQQFTNRTHTTVTEMVDIVDLDSELTGIALIVGHLPVIDAVTQVNQVTDNFQDILFRQGGDFQRQLQTKLMVQLEATNRREVITFLIEEQAREKCIRALDRRRITGAQATVNLDFGLFR